MKPVKAISLVMVLLLGALAAGTADARGRFRAHVGVFIGAPILFAPWYYHPYPYPYYYHPAYYYPPAVVVPPAPPAYVEPQAVPQRADPYWYYCPEARAYFPYVQQCAGGWQRVVPQPPPPS